ncbi:hypothetical protein K439DRAFT_1260195, partial [Ramaria rubella]
LHLHLMLWVENSLTPQEIRERIMDPNSSFQATLIPYLEGLHRGDYLMGTQEEVKRKIDEEEKKPSYQNPMLCSPVKLPSCQCTSCSEEQSCQVKQSWWISFKNTVDDLVFRSNRHLCCMDRCLNNKWNKCKACFPRSLFQESFVDETGHINLQKREGMINTFNTLLTYLLRCNTDVTSLMSGTSIKAVIAYVTDYVTKSPLKTYNIFETICEMFER